MLLPPQLPLNKQTNHKRRAQPGHVFFAVILSVAKNPHRWCGCSIRWGSFVASLLRMTEKGVQILIYRAVANNACHPEQSEGSVLFTGEYGFLASLRNDSERTILLDKSEFDAVVISLEQCNVAYLQYISANSYCCMRADVGIGPYNLPQAIITVF